MLYSSYIKDVQTNEFEAIVITKKQAPLSGVEDFLELFGMSIVCIQFDTYMQPDMVTCISRIHHSGKHWYGSFRSKSAARVHRDFYTQYGKDQRNKELARVREVTGLDVNPRNMLVLHDRINSLQNHVGRLERQLAAAQSSHAETEAASNTHLASAYRRLQATGDLPVSARLRPLNIPGPAYESVPNAHLDSPQYAMSPPNAYPVQIPVYSMPFLVRPPPTTAVTVFVVRD